MLEQRGFPYDKLCIVQAESVGTITASAAGLATTGGSAAYFDTGGGYTKGQWIVDAHFVGSSASQAAMRLRLQGSTTTTFSTYVNLAAFDLGYLTRTLNNVAKLSGRYHFPFHNDFGGIMYRYLRVYMTKLGTLATGIDYASFLSIE